MPHLIVEAMNQANQWSALAPDGVTPSVALSLSDDAAVARFGVDGTSGRISGSAAALHHTLRRTLPGLDLSDYDELRLWLRSDRVANGSPTQPFFLELWLGSDALPPEHAGNSWVRSLPVFQAEEWELVRLSLRDLPAAIRSAVTRLHLRCIEASQPFTCHLDDLLAVREAMIADVDEALWGSLHEQVSVEGTPIAAVLAHPGLSEPEAPFIRVRHTGLRLARNRRQGGGQRSDFRGNTFALLPDAIGYDLFYEVTLHTSSRAEEVQLLEFLLDRFSPRSYLLVNGTLLPIEHIEPEGMPANEPHLRLKVATARASGLPTPATPPFNEIIIASGYKSG